MHPPSIESIRANASRPATRPILRASAACTLAAGAALISALCSPASAQVVNPADKQKSEQELELERLRQGEIPPTVVTAQRVSEYREEDRIGPYGQPSWTAYRRFPTTRVYVRPPGSFGFEYWSRPKLPRHGPAEIQTQYEFEVGLPGRFQVDMYLVNNQTGNEGESSVNEQKLELRYALADWDEIPFNPTLYVELVNKDQAPDVLEYKLLLGGELKPSWHWGANLVLEHETGGELTNEYELTLGLSHTMEDEKWSLGGELKGSLTDTHADRGDYEQELKIGPSLQYRPFPNVHMDFAPLIGIGPDSPDAEIFFVLGYDF